MLKNSNSASIFVKLVDAEYRSCVTPRQQNGLCQPPITCPVLWKLIQNKPVASETREFLLASKCGIADNKPLLCCPIANDAAASSITTERVSTIGYDVNSRIGIIPYIYLLFQFNTLLL